MSPGRAKKYADVVRTWSLVAAIRMPPTIIAATTASTVVIHDERSSSSVRNWFVRGGAGVSAGL